MCTVKVKKCFGGGGGAYSFILIAIIICADVYTIMLIHDCMIHYKFSRGGVGETV